MRQLHRQKAIDFQVAAQIAHGYTVIFNYSPEQAKECQKLSAVASRAARRHLWALLDTRTDAPAFSMARIAAKAGVDLGGNPLPSQRGKRHGPVHRGKQCKCDSPKPSSQILNLCIVCGGFFRVGA